MRVEVKDNNLDKALSVLGKKMEKEGIMRRLKELRAYEKPSDKKRRIRRENERKRMLKRRRNR